MYFLIKKTHTNPRGIIMPIKSPQDVELIIFSKDNPFSTAKPSHRISPLSVSDLSDEDYSDSEEEVLFTEQKHTSSISLDSGSRSGPASPHDLYGLEVKLEPHKTSKVPSLIDFTKRKAVQIVHQPNIWDDDEGHNNAVPKISRSYELISPNQVTLAKNKLTSQLGSIEKIISDSTQEEDLIKPVLSETQKQVVQTLVLSIRQAMRKLDEQQTQAPSAILRQNQFSEFKKTCDEAIREARPVLDPLGFKEILANLALAILGLGVFYVVAGLINRERHGNFLFFRPSVVAKQLGLDEIKQEISSMTMPTQGGSH